MSPGVSALVCAASAVGAGVAGTYAAAEFRVRGPKYLYGMLIGTTVGAAVSSYLVVTAECKRCYEQCAPQPRFP